MSSAELLCDRLAELVAGEREQVLTDIAAVLRELAVELRDGDVRITLCRTGLPASITRALAAIHEPINRQFLSLAEQAGRSAANLAADCDPGRDVLLDAEYVAECSRVIALCTECVDEALLAVKALVASLLNLVVEGHERAVEVVAQTTPALFSLSERLMERDELDVQLVQWIWSILEITLEDHVEPEYISRAVYPFATARAILPVMSCASTLLETWANAETVDYTQYTDALATIIHFVEHAVWAGGEDEKAFGKIKGSLINALVGLSSWIPISEAVYWNAMRRWLDERDDLQSCALLAFGNHAQSDAAAEALLESVLPAIRRILQPGISPQVLHGVIGLIRNLSIPEANKAVLGEELLDRFVLLGVWSAERDMLGSVQGGAIGAVKNLCRGNVENARKLASHQAMQEILSLLERTDDPAIRFECTRVFVNCIRTVYSAPAQDTPLEDPRIVSALVSMFKESGPYPVLANESVIGLALLVTFGSAGTVALAQSQLVDCLDRVVDILRGDTASEVQANTVTLLRQVDARVEDPLIGRVKAELDAEDL